METTMPVREICESSTYRGLDPKRRFNLGRLQQELVSDPEFTAASPALSQLYRELGNKETNYILKSLIRFAFLIQLVTNEVNTTLYEVRWSPRLSSSDPRWADSEECISLFAASFNLIMEQISTPEGRRAIKGMIAYNKLANEIPIDYKDPHASRLHAEGNIHSIDLSLVETIINQRRILLGNGEVSTKKVFNGIYEKVRVKTYLTDRVMTGINKTNRELRWETHPSSVHFALRKECMAIEQTLVDQLCRLYDIPQPLRDALIEEGLLPDDSSPTRCPVTLDLLSYIALAAELVSRHQGKSGFQVGHLNPLKAINDDPTTGHTAKNVSWISQDGNRIQGHLSLSEVRTLLSRIRDNYDRLMPASET
ncbi:hypothetical protein [Streptosporangium sandarakinum]|uniref:hypothetical protein n=1 Tax=Streptosporangium sandarakinum TaxID=1260955 RepID=UPI00379417B7